MTFNWLFIPAILIGWLLFGIAYAIGGRKRSTAVGIALALVAALAAIPGVLFLCYFLHWFDSCVWYCEFRSVPGTELLAGGLGFAGGLVARGCGRVRWFRLPAVAVLLLCTTGAIFVPHSKPFILPPKLERLDDSREGLVCMQSTGFSCGPACATTLLRLHGIPASERELARDCFTYGRGTENWYIARALRERGLRVTVFTRMPPDGVPAPCIAGVDLHGGGHYIVVLEDLGDAYRTADPLVGESVWPKSTISNCYKFTGFFMRVEKP